MEVVNKMYEGIFANKYSATILSTFLVLYGGLASPELPDFVKTLFDNHIFKMVVLSLVAYSVNKNIRLAVLLATVFSIILAFASYRPKRKNTIKK